MEMPLSTLERIMRNAGAERLTEGAVQELNREVQDLAEELADEAIEFAEERGEERISLEDVKEASES